MTCGHTCISPTLAAGWPPINTVEHPTIIEPPWAVLSPNLAAGLAEDENASWGIIHDRMKAIKSIIVKLNIEQILVFFIFLST